MARLLLILFSVIPGTGAILLGREWRGALLMFAGLNAWNLALLRFLWDHPWAHTISGAGVVVGTTCSLVSVIWTALLSSPSRKARLREEADRALRLAYEAYLGDTPEKALAAADAGLKIRRDDADLLFVSWAMTYRLFGRRRAASKLRRLRRVDREEKWAWEIEREVELRDRQAS